MDFASLYARDRDQPQRIAVVGDTLLDDWVETAPFSCPDLCPTGKTLGHHSLPGGAANVARQFENWHSRATLLGPLSRQLAQALKRYGKSVDQELAFEVKAMPVKRRYRTAAGKLLFRADSEAPDYDLAPSELEEIRSLTVKAVRELPWNAILLVDYMKGFVDERLAENIIRIARHRDILVIADPKRPPEAFAGALLKTNEDYFSQHESSFKRYAWPRVTTYGASPPWLQTLETQEPFRVFRCVDEALAGVPCRNHVGAGDCFLAHLCLGLLHGLGGRDAARFAHHAGRVYVQHLDARPPSHYEIVKDYDPIGGKWLERQALPSLADSLRGRQVIFTNGVFRLPHAGHAWFLEQARKRGDVLVVGINDDSSAARQRPGATILPLRDRVQMLASFAFVDWIVPFGEDTPEALLKVLAAPLDEPVILAKGAEYAGTIVPGQDLAVEVVFIEASPFPQHATTLIQDFQHKCPTCP